MMLFGLACGGVALITQIILRLARSPIITSNVTPPDLKVAAGFVTWNPNTLGQAAILLTFGAGIAAILAQHGYVRKFYLILATTFAIMPAAILIRSSAIAVWVGYLGVLCLLRKWKVLLGVLSLTLAGTLYWYPLISNAVSVSTRIDISTGEGFSGRYRTWHTAIEAISESPLIGHGFGQEMRIESMLGSESRSHNTLLSVWMELGLVGVAIFFALLIEFISAGLSIYKWHPLRPYGALLLALIVALCIDSLAGLTLYWEKLPIIALSLGVSLLGCCERTVLCQNDRAEVQWGGKREYACVEGSAASTGEPQCAG